MHATAPSLLGNSYIGTVAEGYPLARVPLIHVRTRGHSDRPAGKAIRAQPCKQGQLPINKRDLEETPTRFDGRAVNHVASNRMTKSSVLVRALPT